MQILFDCSKEEIKIIYPDWTLTAWRNKKDNLIYTQSKVKGKRAKPPKAWGRNFKYNLCSLSSENTKQQDFIEKTISNFDNLLGLNK